MTVNEVTSSNVWDISDIERESNHWTLSSDVNMLQFLQTFSDNMMSKLNSTSESLEQLICFTEEVSTKVNNTFNDFNMLSNVQFIESRVYEDDETNVEDDNQQLPEIKDEETSEVIGARIKTSIEYGLTVLDAAYTVRLLDENDEDSELVIDAKDPYSSRNLPFLIGSSEYCSDDTAGIALFYQSDEESSKSEEEESSEEEDDDDVEVEAAPRTVSEGDTVDSVSTLNTSLKEDDVTNKETGNVTSDVTPVRTASIFDKPPSTRDKVFDSIFDTTDESESEEESERTPPAPAPSEGYHGDAPSESCHGNAPSEPSIASRSPSITSSQDKMASSQRDNRDTRSSSVSSTRSHKTPKGVPKGAVSIFGGRTVFEGGAIKVIESESEEEEKGVGKEVAVEAPTKKQLPPPRTSRGIFSSSEEESEEEERTRPTHKKKGDIPKKNAAPLFDSSSSPDTGNKDKKLAAAASSQKKAAGVAASSQKAATFDSIFGSNSDEDSDDMFGAPTMPKEEKQSMPSADVKSTPKGSLFSESDDESLGFEETKNKVLPTKKEGAIRSGAAKKVDTKIKDELFDSSDDDTSSNLFGFNSNKKSQQEQVVQKEPTPAKPTAEKEVITKNYSPKGKSDDLFASDSEDDLFPSVDKTQKAPNPIADQQRNIASSLMKEAMSKTAPVSGTNEENDADVSRAAKEVIKPVPNKKEKGLFDSSDDEEESTTNRIGKSPEEATKTTSAISTASQKKNLASSLMKEAIAKSSNQISPTQKEEKLKELSSSPTPEESKEVERSIPSESSKGLFDSSNDKGSGDNIFQEDPTAATETNNEDVIKASVEPDASTNDSRSKQRKRSGLFDLNDSDSDDMFNPPKQTSAVNKSEIRRQSQLSDLFVDSDEDAGDIFIKPSRTTAPQTGIAEEKTEKEQSPGKGLDREKEKLKHEPPAIPDEVVETKQKKLQARAAKFDDLFADSDDDEDMFNHSNEKETTVEDAKSRSNDVDVMKKPTPPAISDSEELVSSTLVKMPAEINVLNTPELPRLSTEKTAKEVADNTVKEAAIPAVLGGGSSTPDIMTNSPSSQIKKASPDSKIAKLGNTLNFNPAMLMGGPRPMKKNNDSEGNTDSSVPINIAETPGTSSGTSSGKVRSEASSSADVLLSVTKGRAKRGGRRPPSRVKPSTQSTPEQTTQPPATPSTPSAVTQSPASSPSLSTSGPALLTPTTSNPTSIKSPSSPSTLDPNPLPSGKDVGISETAHSIPEATPQQSSRDPPPMGPQATPQQSSRDPPPMGPQATPQQSSRDPPPMGPQATPQQSSRDPPPMGPVASDSFQVKGSSYKSKGSTIFEDSLFGDDVDIFADKPKTSKDSRDKLFEDVDIFADDDKPKKKKATRDTLFDVEDIFETSRPKETPKESPFVEDIFETSSPKETPKESPFVEDIFETSRPKETLIGEKIAKKKSSPDDIFGDLDDDDDLFGSKGSGKNKAEKSTKSISESKTPSSATNSAKTSGKSKKPPKKDVDIFADDFDLFADVTAPTSKKGKKNQKKSTPKKSVDFDDPLFG